jgi:hypothetical protein
MRLFTVFLRPSRQILGVTLKQATTASYCIPSTSSFTTALPFIKLSFVK